MEDQCVITSVKLGYLERVKEMAPELRTGYILAAAYGTYYDNEYIDFISIRSSFVGRKLVEAAHEKGKAVHVWTVNSKTEIEQMKLLGVDNIITDLSGAGQGDTLQGGNHRDAYGISENDAEIKGDNSI